MRVFVCVCAWREGGFVTSTRVGDVGRYVMGFVTGAVCAVSLPCACVVMLCTGTRSPATDLLMRACTGTCAFVIMDKFFSLFPCAPCAPAPPFPLFPFHPPPLPLFACARVCSPASLSSPPPAPLSLPV